MNNSSFEGSRGQLPTDSNGFQRIQAGLRIWWLEFAKVQGQGLKLLGRGFKSSNGCGFFFKKKMPFPPPHFCSHVFSPGVQKKKVFFSVRGVLSRRFFPPSPLFFSVEKKSL